MLHLFWAFLKVGFLSLGGGYVFYPLLKEEVVHNYGWLTVEEFTEVTGITQFVPGAISIKFASYVGYRVGGIVGVAVAILGVILPPVIIIILLASFLSKYQHYPIFDSALKGVKFATLGLILFFAYQLASSISPEGKGFLLTGLVLGGLILDVPPGVMIIIGSLIGIIIF